MAQVRSLAWELLHAVDAEKKKIIRLRKSIAIQIISLLICIFVFFFYNPLVPQTLSSDPPETCELGPEVGTKASPKLLPGRIPARRLCSVSMYWE